MIDRSVPLGWMPGGRFKNSYVSDTNQAILFIDEDDFTVRLMKEVPEQNDNIGSFKSVEKKKFNSFDDAWLYAHKLMMNETAMNRVRQKYSRKKKSTIPKAKKKQVKKCRCK